MLAVAAWPAARSGTVAQAGEPWPRAPRTRGRGEGEMMREHPLERGAARLLIRRHCADLIAEGIATEETLTNGFVKCLAAMPDIPMGVAAEAFHDTCWEM